jgi:hypothetical protein
VHAPSEERNDDSKDSFYEESEEVLDGRIILRSIFRKFDGGECMDCIYLAQDRESWRALVNAVMEFGFHKMLRIS